MAKTLLSFAGFHDPGLSEDSKGATQAGPILTLVREVGFERVILLRTPGAIQNTNLTDAALRQLYPGLCVVVEDLGLPDPTDYKVIFDELRRTLRRISEEDADASPEYFIGLA